MATDSSGDVCRSEAAPPLKPRGAASPLEGLVRSSVGSDVLIALVRLLAREAARDFVVRAMAPESRKQPKADDTR